tara:strand:- start:1469 stop:1954 length:486 start_codon:yes stop_codon:yes gene_type:complete
MKNLIDILNEVLSEGKYTVGLSFILRYTSNPRRDMDNGHSYHQLQDILHYDGLEKYVNGTDIYDGLSAIEIAAHVLDLDVADLEVIDGMLVQKFDGLFGFELESETLEDAIGEAHDFRHNDVYNSKSMSDMISIFVGMILSVEAEGVIFDPKKIVYNRTHE